MVVSTKSTVTRDPSDPNGGGNHRKNLMLSLETSLRPLRTEDIDIHRVHLWDGATPIDEDVVRAGTVLTIGVSVTPAWVVSRPNTMAEVRGWSAEASGLTVAAWSPLAGGVLSAKFTTGGAVDPGSRIAASSLTERDRAIPGTPHAVAEDVGATPTQVAIAWDGR